MWCSHAGEAIITDKAIRAFMHTLQQQSQWQCHYSWRKCGWSQSDASWDINILWNFDNELPFQGQLIWQFCYQQPFHHFRKTLVKISCIIMLRYKYFSKWWPWHPFSMSDGMTFLLPAAMQSLVKIWLKWVQRQPRYKKNCGPLGLLRPWFILSRSSQ